MRRLFIRFPEGKKKAVTLSYDDGVTQDIRLMQICDANGLKATFNINSEGYAESEAAEEGKKHKRLTKEQATALYANSGHEVAVHTLTHPSLTELPTASALQEVLQDRINLETQFDRIIRGMAYPFGTTNAAVEQILKGCDIAYARTVRSTFDFRLPTNPYQLTATCKHTAPELPALTAQFLAQDVTRTSTLFYLWGHSYEFDDDNNWDVIEQFAAQIGGKADIWYATNIEIIHYLNMANHLQFNASMTYVENPTATTIWFDYYDKSYLLPAGGALRLPR